jgi:hypothetical protein
VGDIFQTRELKIEMQKFSCEFGMKIIEGN